MSLTAPGEIWMRRRYTHLAYSLVCLMMKAQKAPELLYSSGLEDCWACKSTTHCKCMICLNVLGHWHHTKHSKNIRFVCFRWFDMTLWGSWGLAAREYAWLGGHAYACMCMELRPYVCICMHTHAYGHICMHMHAIACIPESMSMKSHMHR